MAGVHVSLANPAVVEVEEVDRGGAADQAGFRPGDVIVEIAGVLVEGRGGVTGPYARSRCAACASLSHRRSLTS